MESNDPCLFSKYLEEAQLKGKGGREKREGRKRGKKGEEGRRRGKREKGEGIETEEL